MTLHRPGPYYSKGPDWLTVLPSPSEVEGELALIEDRWVTRAKPTIDAQRLSEKSAKRLREIAETDRLARLWEEEGQYAEMWWAYGLSYSSSWMLCKAQLSPDDVTAMSDQELQFHLRDKKRVRQLRERMAARSV